MGKLTKIITALGIVTLLVPSLAFAHNGGNKSFGISGKFNWQNFRTKSGTVTAVGSTTFDLKTENGTTWTVNTAGAKITQAFGNSLLLSGIHVNDKAAVKGTASGTLVTAKTVVVTPPNTHRATGGGKVTAINGNSFTVQQKNHGIVTSFTVNTGASTIFSSTTTPTTTIASLQVGSKVRVKGLWDEILNVLNAIKVKIW